MAVTTDRACRFDGVKKASLMSLDWFCAETNFDLDADSTGVTKSCVKEKKRGHVPPPSPPAADVAFFSVSKGGWGG